MKKGTTKEKQGFSVIELLVALGIFATTATGIVLLAMAAMDFTAWSQTRLKAQALTEEGLEAARSIRAEGWDNLTSGQHGLAIEDGSWTFTGTEETVDGRFKRVVEVTDLTEDRKEVLTRVTWELPGAGKNEVELATRLTNWQKLYESPGSITADVGDRAMDVYVEGDYAYLAVWDQHKSLAVVDISDHNSPELVRNESLKGKGADVFIYKGYGYVVLDTNKVAVVDLSDPVDPIRVSTIYVSAQPSSIFLKDDYAYVGQKKKNEGVEIFSVADPTSPQYQYSINAGEKVYDVEAVDHYCCQRPVVWMAVNEGRGLSVGEDYIYVAVNLADQGFEVYNFSYPYYWKISDLDIGGRGADVDREGDVFTAAQIKDEGSVQVDVDDPYDPQFVEGVSVGGVANGVFASQDYIYYAVDNEDGGFAIVER